MYSHDIPHNMPKFSLRLYEKAYSSMQSGRFMPKPWVLEIYVEHRDDDERKEAMLTRLTQPDSDNTLNNAPELELYASGGAAGYFDSAQSGLGSKGIGGRTNVATDEFIYDLLGPNNRAYLGRKQLKLRLEFPSCAAVEDYLAQVGIAKESLIAQKLGAGAESEICAQAAGGEVANNGVKRAYKGYLANFAHY